MKNTLLLIVFTLHTVALLAQFNYPKTATVDSSDIHYGIRYPDKYRWLEHLQQDSVVNWYKSQAAFADAQLQKIEGRKELLNEWNEVIKGVQTRYKEQSKRNNRLFYKKTLSGGSAKLYFKDETTGEESLLFDPLEFEPEKKYVLQTATPNADGSKIVVTLTNGGSEISRIKILDVSSKTITKDDIFPCFSSVYFLDDESFLYTSLKTGDVTSTEFLKNNTIKLHKIGSDSKTDKVCFGNEYYPELQLKPENLVYTELAASCPNYVFASVGNDDGLSTLYYANKSDLYKAHISWKSLSTANDKLVNKFVFANNAVFAFTNIDEKNYKLVSTNLKAPDWKNPATIAVEKNNLWLNDFIVLQDYILVSYSDGINHRLIKYDFKSKRSSEIKLPFKGTLLLQNHFEEPNACYITITSWNRPYTEYKLNTSTESFSASDFNVPNSFPEKFLDTEIEEIEVKGHDGTLIPLSIIYKKGLKKDGTNICLMQGYGAYGFSIPASFNYTWMSLVSKGVVVAVAHVRGGGEKGSQWEKGGLKTTKPNTWKDFNSCAEYLINNEFTRGQKIICESGSVGGILIGRAITERPDLYGAAISNAGVLNALRGEQMPNGANIAYQNGTVTDSIECKALYEMDALHHIKEKTAYPAIICSIGWNDPRASVWQSSKFVAAMQSQSNSNKPILLKVNYNNGHFASLEDLADNWALALWQCGHPDFKVIE